jgi:AraC family transcriptional regulator of adaptative response / DNA-3-methyladenine glycosylase II
MRLIADGEVERSGVPGLAARLGYSERHLDRLLTAEVGAGPLALARARRTRTARTLLETTALGMTDVAFAAGFGSVRQFNETMRRVFALSPSELRARARGPARRARGADTESICLRLAHRRPFDGAALVAFLAQRAVTGVEEVVDGVYRRVLRLAHGLAVATLAPPRDEAAGARSGTGYVLCTLRLEDLRDLASAVERCRRLFDLDADPAAIAAVLGEDAILGPSVAARPGLRLPGSGDGNELAVRAVLGQQVSVAAARTFARVLSERYGESLSSDDGGLRRAFPRAAALADVDAAALPLPRARAETLRTLCRRLTDGSIVLDAGADRDAVEAALLGIAGIGPWTTAYIRMRALSDPDAFLPTDLGVRRALERLGLAADPVRARARAERWRPWRSYALMHLWAAPGPPPEAPAASAADRRGG